MPFGASTCLSAMSELRAERCPRCGAWLTSSSDVRRHQWGHTPRREETQMRLVVAGATGLIGSKTVARLRGHGVEVALISRREGVDVMTGEGLPKVLRGAYVVVDVTEAPSSSLWRTCHVGCRTRTVSMPHPS
ncbi:NAD-dependent epimerase/dehydratase family protein [Streptomyces mirabilis]|uniref:NAD-dependent epimerase/dehydratase family protein n=1 Tax=Streptomyces mirabilis TaxID=68239 RepID=UPI003723FB38